MDQNHTIEPLTWYEQLRDFRYEMEGKPKNNFRKVKARPLLKDHVVVHVSFTSSKVEMNVLDARYSFYDKIAKLGGTLGLCTQMTGGSFLTIIHLIVLIIKVCITYCSRCRY